MIYFLINNLPELALLTMIICFGLLTYHFFRWTLAWYPFYKDGNVTIRSKLCFKNYDVLCFSKKIWNWLNLQKEVSFKKSSGEDTVVHLIWSYAHYTFCHHRINTHPLFSSWRFARIWWSKQRMKLKL